MKNEDDEEYKRFYKMRKITASVLMSIDNSFKRLMDVAFLALCLFNTTLISSLCVALSIYPFKLD